MDYEGLPAPTRAAFEHLIEPLRGVELPAPTGYHVLALQWVRPQASSGGIIYADQTKAEDEYQGRVGLVLAVGPDAFRGDKFASGPWCKMGDIVMWAKLQSAATRFTYNGVVLTILSDDQIKAVGVDPGQTIATGKRT